MVMTGGDGNGGRTMAAAMEAEAVDGDGTQRQAAAAEDDGSGGRRTTAADDGDGGRRRERSMTAVRWGERQPAAVDEGGGEDGGDGGR